MFKDIIGGALGTAAVIFAAYGSIKIIEYIENRDSDRKDING